MFDTPVGSVTRLETKAGGYGPAHLLLRVLDHLEEWLIATLIATATALIFFAVVHRYGTGLSINGAKWAEAHGVPGVPVILRPSTPFFPSSTCPGRRSFASLCSSGWPSSAPPMACAPASTWASMSSSICCRPKNASR